MHMYSWNEIESLILKTISWNCLGKKPKLQESVLGFENTFTLGTWTLSRPFPTGEVWPKREILNFTF